MKIKPWFLYWVKENSGVKPTGEIEITENGNYNVTNYATANVNIPITNNAKIKAQFEPLSSSSQGTTTVVIRSIEEMPQIDLTNMTALSSAFYRAKNLKRIKGGFINSGNITTLAMCFNECNSLIDAPTFDSLSSLTDFSSCFRDVPNLENVPVYNIPNVTNMAYTFGNAPKLTDESLNNIMATCITATSVTSGKSLDSIGLSSAQRSKCQTLSNYQDFLNAGWTA